MKKYYAIECSDATYSGRLFQFKSMKEAREKAVELGARVLLVLECNGNGVCMAYDCIEIEQEKQ